ncbi:MAG: FKBP-type peptidyl-prolyl cis-trans isomerase [Balneolales bacterium]
MQKNIAVLSIITMFAVACNQESDYDKQVKTDDEVINNYISDHNIAAQKTESGVYYEPIVENEHGNQAVENDVVTVRYAMKLLHDVEVIETYADTLLPVRFSNSTESIEPKVLTRLIGLMREGEQYRFFIPSYRAFGEYSHPNLFSVNSNFILDLEIVSFKTEDDSHKEEIDQIENYLVNHDITTESFSNGLFIETIKEGSGEKPGTHSSVRYHFTISYLDGTVIASSTDSNPVVETLGQERLPEGLEQGIKQMNTGGEARILIPSELAFGKSFQVIPQTLRKDWVNTGNLLMTVLPYTPVLYEIELLEIL